MRVEFKYDFYSECCDKMSGALLSGKIEFDETQGEFFYQKSNKTINKCPYCHEQIERIDFDY